MFTELMIGQSDVLEQTTTSKIHLYNELHSSNAGKIAGSSNATGAQVFRPDGVLRGLEITQQAAEPQERLRQDFCPSRPLLAVADSARLGDRRSILDIADDSTVDQRHGSFEPLSSPSNQHTPMPAAYISSQDAIGSDAAASSMPMRTGRVASNKSIERSMSRRRNPASLVCNVEGCGQTFTKHHNLKGRLHSP